MRKGVDDVIVDVTDDAALDSLKASLEEVSGLVFTIERSIENKISYLDINIDASDSTKYVTQVYRKPTDTGKCLHGESQCPDRYKVSVIRSYVYRALKHCSSWPLVHEELQRVKQLHLFSLRIGTFSTERGMGQFISAAAFKLRQSFSISTDFIGIEYRLFIFDRRQWISTGSFNFGMGIQKRYFCI